jgi:phosphoglucosamine mutase
VSVLQVLAALRLTGIALKAFCDDLTIYPQVLKNVKVPKGFDFHDSLAVQAALVEAECELAGRGRVLLRPSGTEPVLRVMVESDDVALTERWAAKLAEVVSNAL